MRRAASSSEGFTLIEVLIALGAMMVGMTALWGLHMSSLKVDARNNNETAAVFLAERVLEQLRATAVTNFGGLASGSDVPQAPFQRNWTVSGMNSWRKDITVTVTWPEQIKMASGARTSVNRRVQMSTILVMP